MIFNQAASLPDISDILVTEMNFALITRYQAVSITFPANGDVQDEGRGSGFWGAFIEVSGARGVR